MALITCPECGHQISDKADNCPNCGCPVEKKTNKCKECGVELPEGCKECPNCGLPVNKIPTQQQGSLVSYAFCPHCGAKYNNKNKVEFCPKCGRSISTGENPKIQQRNRTILIILLIIGTIIGSIAMTKHVKHNKEKVHKQRQELYEQRRAEVERKKAEENSIRKEKEEQERYERQIRNEENRRKSEQRRVENWLKGRWYSRNFLGFPVEIYINSPSEVSKVYLDGELETQGYLYVDVDNDEFQIGNWYFDYNMSEGWIGKFSKGDYIYKQR